MSPVIPQAIEQELVTSYLDYAMSVIVSRALPDVRDGLKPVQRRLLYVMYELALYPDKPYKKSARIVGETLGKFHPHGDVPVYETLVRLAQDFTMRYPLIDGQGNFGSIDDDPPAAMRYTEARLSPIALEMLADIDKGTIDFIPNFDNSTTEPVVLPAKLPNLLINGCSGIAVGMSTNIPPHNLSEVCQALVYLIDHPSATLPQIMDFIKGPDFPTGGILLGTKGIEEAYRTGQGKLTLQASAYIEKSKGKEQIIISSIPYQVSKAAIVEKIAKLAQEGKIDGIAGVRDESDRHSIRVVVELKRDAHPQIVLNQLYHLTPLQSTYSLHFLVLVDRKPKTAGLIELLQLYLDHRYQVVIRRTRFELDQLKERAHLLEGFQLALQNLDKVVDIIRNSPDTESAKQRLISSFSLTPTQAQAILDMPLKKLCTLEVNRLLDEYKKVKDRIEELERLLSSPELIWGVIKEEIQELAKRFPSERRTQIGETVQLAEEELVPSQEVVIAVSQGYIKRLDLDSFRGKQLTIQAERLIQINTHSYLLLITEAGQVYRLKAFQVPEAAKTSRGTPLSKLIPLKEGKVAELLSVEEFSPESSLLLATALGRIKRVSLSEFDGRRSQGLQALKLKDGDRVIGAKYIPSPSGEVVLISSKGKAVRFPLSSLPLSPRSSPGIVGQKLSEDDKLGFIEVVSEGDQLFIITENGYGQLIDSASIPLLPSPGGVGRRVINITKSSGPVAAVRTVLSSGRVIVITSSGNAYIWRVSDLPAKQERLISEGTVLSLALLD